MLMTLRILSHSLRQRIEGARFQHSIASVSLFFGKCLKALRVFAMEMIKSYPFEDVQPAIRNNRKWFPYFQHCIGAIDGTHVSAWTYKRRKKAFMGRKGSIVTSNVLAVCNHDMLFTFVYSGWEGSAHDSRVFYDAVTKERNNFPKSNGGMFMS